MATRTTNGKARNGKPTAMTWVASQKRWAKQYLRPNVSQRWLRGTDTTNRDFGMVTLARNPFAANDEYVCILAAGFHPFGIAHAVRFLSDPSKFRSHPLGGVIRVNYDSGTAFAKRFDASTAEWGKAVRCYWGS